MPFPSPPGTIHTNESVWESLTEMMKGGFSMSWSPRCFLLLSEGILWSFFTAGQNKQNCFTASMVDFMYRHVFHFKSFSLPWDIRRLCWGWQGWSGHVLTREGEMACSYCTWALKSSVTLLVYSPCLIGPIDPHSETSPELILSPSPFPAALIQAFALLSRLFKNNSLTGLPVSSILFPWIHLPDCHKFSKTPIWSHHSSAFQSFGDSLVTR